MADILICFWFVFGFVSFLGKKCSTGENENRAQKCSETWNFWSPYRDQHTHKHTQTHTNLHHLPYLNLPRKNALSQRMPRRRKKWKWLNCLWLILINWSVCVSLCECECVCVWVYIWSVYESLFDYVATWKLEIRTVWKIKLILYR